MINILTLNFPAAINRLQRQAWLDWIWRIKRINDINNVNGFIFFSWSHSRYQAVICCRSWDNDVLCRLAADSLTSTIYPGCCCLWTILGGRWASAPAPPHHPLYLLNWSWLLYIRIKVIININNQHYHHTISQSTKHL